MYIEERKSEMDQEVNEATAALKGLLGIGSPSNSIIPPTNPTTKEEKEENGGSPELVSPEQPSKTKKKRNNKKKKKQDEATADKNSSPPKPPKPQSQSNESSAQKPKNNSTKKKGSKNNNNKNAENFAWSAFQSSPDASKLPIPAFSSPVQSRKTISDTQLNHSNASELPVTEATEDANTNNPTQSTLQPPGTPAAANGLADTNTDSTPTKEESATGVNLAVLASNPPPSTPNDAVHHASPQGQLFSSPQHAYPNHASPHLHHPFTPPPPHPMHHQYPYLPPPPPGHVTIQVQVPHVLMPGRQMVVTSPAGCPVQIAIPEGYQAGMIIPVFVPAAPPMQYMMPPPQPNNSHLPFNHAAGGYYNSNVG